MLRVFSSPVKFTASPQTVTSRVDNLIDVVSETATLQPWRLRLATQPPEDVLVREVRLQSPTDPTSAHRLYVGEPVPLGEVMSFFTGDVVELTLQKFRPRDGMELVFEVESCPSEFTTNVLWGVHNDDDDDQGEDEDDDGGGAGQQLTITELCQLFTAGRVDGDVVVTVPGSGGDDEDDDGGGQQMTVAEICGGTGTQAGTTIIIIDPSVIRPPSGPGPLG